jgi:hypothetical protein
MQTLVESIRKGFAISKEQFPSSSEISSRGGPAKADPVTSESDRGSQIDVRDEQSTKTALSIRISFESDSNVTRERLRHARKQFSQSVSTEEGMQIDASAEQSQNAELSMQESFDPASNLIPSRFLQEQKAFSRITSTEDGMQISVNAEQPKKALHSMRES